MPHSLPALEASKSRPRAFARMALATMLAAVLAGCGNKGPLYLPEEPPPPAGGTAEAGEGDNSDAESDTGDGT